MLQSVLLYAKERSPVPFILLLSVILFASGLQNANINSADFLIGTVTMFLFLFLIRLSDDICDIPIDRITHPNRVLCSGKAPLQQMNRFRVIALLIILTLQIPHWEALLFMALSLLFYAVFFSLKPKLPTFVHITILNSSLFIFPVYAGLLFYQQATAFHVLLGVFFWLGGLAHDFSHSLLDTRGIHPKTLNPINRINQTCLAWLSFALFMLSSFIGFALYLLQWVGLYFLIPLIITCVMIFYLEIHLIKQPSEKTAKPFYTLGFVFFLLPALGHILYVFTHVGY